MQYGIINLTNQVEYFYQENRNMEENQQIKFKEMENMENIKSLNTDIENEADHESRENVANDFNADASFLFLCPCSKISFVSCSPFLQT